MPTHPKKKNAVKKILVRKTIPKWDLVRYNTIIREQKNIRACIETTGLHYRQLIAILDKGIGRNDLIAKLEKFCNSVEPKESYTIDRNFKTQSTIG